MKRPSVVKPPMQGERFSDDDAMKASFFRMKEALFLISKGVFHMKTDIKRLTLAALFLALCLALPFLTGQIPAIGSALSPMHIPVLLCGFVCGWPYGALIGLIAPLLRSLIFGMPPLFPTAVAMSLELATYGAVSGWMYALLPKRTVFLYIALVIAMLSGRAAWGLIRFLIAGLGGSAFTFDMFLAGAFTSAVPGIICHIALIPLIVLGLRKANVMPPEKKKAAA